MAASKKDEATQPVIDLAVLKQQAEAASSDPAAKQRYGWALYVLGRYEEASQVFTDALARFPDDLEVVYGTALALRMAGDKARSKELFSRIPQLVEGINNQAKAGMLSHLARAQLAMLG
jgi:Flp pilus assembly protein TadD